MAGRGTGSKRKGKAHHDRSRQGGRVVFSGQVGALPESRYVYAGDDAVPDAELAGARARGVIHARQLGGFIRARKAALGS